MNLRIYILTLAAAVTICSCDDNPYGPTGYIPPTPQPEEPVTAGGYAKGADISWITEMEKDGQKFYNAAGEQKECTALMKELGFNSIRLRVWVDPDGGWCGAEDVLIKARRAQALGMRIMIDFHYSDSWADPSKQNVPADWTGQDVAGMASAVGNHTSEVLDMLKDNDVDVEWVQIGNEVNGGMLWPTGKVQGREAGNFIKFANAGYAAVKEVYPSAKVILHISNGHDNSLFDWFFNLMKLGAAKYDIIGMSLYPSWWENNGWRDWKTNTDLCISNIKTISGKYGKPVMICEFGMPVWEPQKAKEAAQYLLEKTKEIEACHGVFYWEPQTDGAWKPANYTNLGWKPYEMGAFSNGKPTIALDPFYN